MKDTLQVSVDSQKEGAAVMYLQGGVDIKPSLPETIIIDLNEVSYIDRSGIATLMEGFEIARIARIAERERIAQDLHDTLLQSVQGLILKFSALTMRIPPEDTTRHEMEKTLSQANEVVREGRDRIRNLRAFAASRGDLPEALQRVADEISPGSAISFEMLVEDVARELHPMVLEESYYIGREALINAFRHSGGSHIELRITYHSRQLRLRVHDDGRGIDPAVLEKRGRENHWGLLGMQERAKRIGAELNLSSRPGGGTEVELTVPAATAYQTSVQMRSPKAFSQMEPREHRSTATDHC